MPVLEWTPMTSDPDVCDTRIGTFRLQLCPVDDPKGDAWRAGLFDDRGQLPDETWKFRAPSLREARATAETGALNCLNGYAGRIGDALAAFRAG